MPSNYGQYEAHRFDSYAVHGQEGNNYNRSCMQAQEHNSPCASKAPYGGAINGIYHEHQSHGDFEDGVWVGLITLLHVSPCLEFSGASYFYSRIFGLISSLIFIPVIMFCSH